MSEELSGVVKKQTELLGLFKEVRDLKRLLQEKDNKIRLLENRVDELEQHIRMEEVIVSGLHIKHRPGLQLVAVGPSSRRKKSSPWNSRLLIFFPLRTSTSAATILQIAILFLKKIKTLNLFLLSGLQTEK